MGDRRALARGGVAVGSNFTLRDWRDRFSLIVMRENSFTTRDLCGCGILSRGFGNGIPSTSDMVFHLHLMKAAGRRAIAP
jgi:hypothetical protein